MGAGRGVTAGLSADWGDDARQLVGVWDLGAAFSRDVLSL